MASTNRASSAAPAATSEGQEPRGRAAGRWTSWRSACAATGLLALAASGILALDARQADRLDRAERAGLDGDHQLALWRARDVGGDLAGPRALAVEAYALQGLGRLAESERAFRAALRETPSDWRLRRDLARVLLLQGRRGAASQELSRALALNPRLTPPPGFRIPR